MIPAKPCRPGAAFRGGRTQRKRRSSLGACYRCLTSGAGVWEIGEPAMVVRLCPSCAVIVGAVPLWTCRAAEVPGAALYGPWGSVSVPSYPMCATEEEFKELAVRLLGTERARLALGSCDW
jgi:hypothetical protein